MKLRIGKWLFHEKALKKIAFILFLIGIPIGVKIAAKELYKESSTVIFIIVYAIIIPRLVKNIGDDIERVN